jgi:hypothetical protein
VSGIAERERRIQGRGAALAIVAVAAFFLVLLAFAALLLPQLIYPVPSGASLDTYTHKDRDDLVNARLTLQAGARGAMLQSIVGSMVLFTASVAGYVTYQQVKVARETQLTDRFTKAIGQLGDGNLDVRVGGIWALERLANNSPIDQRAIAQVLNAFVRRRVPWPPASPSSTTEPTAAPALPGASPVVDDDLAPMPQRVPDVQAAMEVLGQEVFSGRVVLPFVDLHVAALAGAHLAGSVFQRANLAVALLSDADLREVEFTGAILRGAILDGADLTKAKLAGADLTKAKLAGAILDGADLTKAKLAGADLRGVDLSGCTIEGVELGGVQVNPATQVARWLPTGSERGHPARRRGRKCHRQGPTAGRLWSRK